MPKLPIAPLENLIFKVSFVSLSKWYAPFCPDVKLLNTSAADLNLQIFSCMCVWVNVYRPLWAFLGVFGQDGHPVISFSHSVVARRLLRLLGSLISLFPPASNTPFQVSYWSTPGQKSYVYFVFFRGTNFCLKNWFWCPGGRMENWVKITFSQNSALRVPNEWQNKITVGDATLCRLTVLSI